MEITEIIDEPFEDETIIERIIGLNEMFPESLRTAVGATISKSTSCLKTVFSATRTVTWILCSTAAILVLPISLETERLEYEQQMKRQERNIILGAESGQGL